MGWAALCDSLALTYAAGVGTCLRRRGNAPQPEQRIRGRCRHLDRGSLWCCRPVGLGGVGEAGASAPV